jgi:hypothetical protein
MRVVFLMFSVPEAWLVLLLILVAMGLFLK